MKYLFIIYLVINFELEIKVTNFEAVLNALLSSYNE